MNRLRSDENAAVAAKRVELDQINRRIRRIVELITDEDAPVRLLKQQLVALEARQLGLEQELAGVSAPAPLLHPTLPKFIGSASSTCTRLCAPTTECEMELST